MTRPEILFLAHRIPYPPNKGDKIRSWQILKHLAKSYDVHLCAFVDDPDDMQHRHILEGVCKSVSLVSLTPSLAKIRSATSLFSGEALSLGYYRDTAMKEAVDKVRHRPLCFQFAFSSTMAPYLDLASAPSFVDLCDADSEKWRQYSHDASFPMAHVYRREANALAQYETKISNDATATFAISEAEARVLQRADVHKAVHWFGNGVDTNYFDPSASYSVNTNPAEVVFVGAMDYRANIDAVLWFVEEVWPRVRTDNPDVRFAIVGSNPPNALAQLSGHDGIDVTGRVEDVRPYLAGAKTVVAPMRIARGVQNKILEAMAISAPVIATSAAAEGISVQAGEDFLCADTPEDFASALSSLLNDDNEQRRLGANARQAILDRYRWSAQLARLDDVIAEHMKPNHD